MASPACADIFGSDAGWTDKFYGKATNLLTLSCHVHQVSITGSAVVGADSKVRIDSALSAQRIRLDQDELFEIERNYTPCDLINDYTAGKRIERVARPAADLPDDQGLAEVIG